MANKGACSGAHAPSIPLSPTLTKEDEDKPKLIKGLESQQKPSPQILQSGSKTVPSQDTRPKRIGLEICCGSAGLTVALIDVGLEAIGIDYKNRHRAKAPFLDTDLASPGGVQQLFKILDDVCVVYVHFGLPCGTFSRAREIEVPEYLQKQGAAAPRPLRSEDLPAGLPGLTADESLRVSKANALVDMCCEVVKVCHARGILWSIENPRSSLLWWMPQMVQLLQLDGTLDVEGQMCMFGGSRAKWFRLRGNFKELKAMAIDCDKSHAHLPWGVRYQHGRWGFHTMEEAEYAAPFSAALAGAVLEAARTRNLGGATPLPLTRAAVKTAATKDPGAEIRRSAKAATGVQPRGRQGKQLISEFADIVLVHCSGDCLDQRWVKGLILDKATVLSGVAIPQGARLIEVRTNTDSSGVVIGSYLRFGVYRNHFESFGRCI